MCICLFNFNLEATGPREEKLVKRSDKTWIPHIETTVLIHFTVLTAGSFSSYLPPQNLGGVLGSAREHGLFQQKAQLATVSGALVGFISFQEVGLEFPSAALASHPTTPFLCFFTPATLFAWHAFPPNPANTSSLSKAFYKSNWYHKPPLTKWKGNGSFPHQCTSWDANSFEPSEWRDGNI